VYVPLLSVSNVCTPLCRHHPQRRSTTILGVVHTHVHCPNTSLICLTAILSHGCYINTVTKFQLEFLSHQRHALVNFVCYLYRWLFSRTN